MLSDVTILVTTFLRPGYLGECLRGIAENLPECKAVVAADDCDLTWNKYLPNDQWIQLPFDSGLTAKRNATVNLSKTVYSLLASDDFDFRSTREGIEKMVLFLDQNPDVDVVVGRVNNKEYEGLLEYVPGEYIKEHRVKPMHSGPTQIDIGINYFLARTEVLREVPWDEGIRPIGGEHADWFLSMKQAGMRVVFLPGVNITTMLYNPKWQHPDYKAYRRRAQQGHELFLKKRGVKRYYSFDEDVR